LGFRVEIAGKNDSTSTYTREIVEFASRHSWCRLAGFLNREQLRARMAAASLLILPSLEENLPMVILEAMAAGLPVAASNVGGIPDIVSNGVTGRLFDPLDPGTMQSAVLAHLRNPAEGQGFAAAARKTIIADHSPLAIARRHLAVYRELLEEGER
jgi:glycosyltransferase involved in cell wall biosynthesis